LRQGLLRRHVHLPVLAGIKLCRSPEFSEYGMRRVGVNGVVEEVEESRS